LTGAFLNGRLLSPEVATRIVADEMRPIERLRCQRPHSLVGTIARSNRESSARLGRTIAQPTPLRTDEAVT